MKSIFFFLAILFIGSSFIPWQKLVPSTQAPPQDDIELGELLFFEKDLSLDHSISCASCHIPQFGFADTVAFSQGVNNQLGSRNTPSTMNMTFREHYFYDGRAASLEEQVIGPIENPVEMNLAYSEAVKRIQANSDYQNYFQEIYGTAPDSAHIALAMATFMRSLESDGSAPHDQWMAGFELAMSESQLRGKEVFLEKGKCFECHFSPDFTGDEFRNVGLYDGITFTDQGRFTITKDSSDLGKFKVPGLRNIALTPPYMHNGMFNTLEEVVEFYDNPYKFVPQPINIDSLMIEPLHLTAQEKEDLVEFLHSLTDVSFPYPIN